MPDAAFTSAFGDALVMGVVNVTPDSFSDGGRYLDHDRAIEHGRMLVAEGAEVLDIGGESTRPGAVAVAADQERERVVPVIEALAGDGARISIDTTKLQVAEAALSAGASMVNDVTALGTDPGIAGLCADRGAELVLMHMKGTPGTMQSDPRYDDVVAEVHDFLAERLEVALGAGVPRGKIWLDPGIGFGKTLEHNLTLIRDLGSFTDLGCRILLGTSRKRFIGNVDGSEVDSRLGGTIASSLLGIEQGATMVRVHDVAAFRQALVVAAAIRRAPAPFA